MQKRIFTSESVTEGHPDKVCDQISDGVLDAIFAKDPNARVACECAATTGMVLVMGEISTNCYVDIPKVARETICRIGYDRPNAGFDGHSCAVLTAIDEQSGDIAMGVNSSYDEADTLGAGDQGMMFGFACDETPELMPAPISMAHQLAFRLAQCRKSGELSWLRPDGKSQVTVEYDENGKVLWCPAIVVSTQHDPSIALKDLREAVVEPFHEFVTRKGWRYALLILLFLFIYKLGDSMATALATPFYLDMGYSKSEIGLIAKNAGLWASVAGGLLGGLWMLQLGINRALWIFGVVQVGSILGFVWLSGYDANLWALGLVIAFEALGVGLGTAAFTAFIARETDPRYTATQFALFTSLAAVPRTVVNASTGYLVAWCGWQNFFWLCTLLAIPGMVLLLKVAPWKAENENKNIN